MDVVIPTEVEPTLRTTTADTPNNNKQQFVLCLELLEEMREKAQFRIATYHHKLKKYYNKKVKTRDFRKENWSSKEFLKIPRNLVKAR